MIGSSFVLSGILGLVRTAIINSRFGTASGELDAFSAAFRIPEALFTLVAGGALGASFIPVFSRFLGKDDPVGAQRLANTVLTWVAAAALGISVVAALFAPALASLLARPVLQALTTELMRIMLLTVSIFSVSGLLMGILNANQHFLAPALAPSMNNLGVIAGAVLLAPVWGIHGVAWGAVLGAVLHLGIQLPALLQINFRPRPSFAARGTGAGEVLTLMLPRVIGQGATQINFLVNTALAAGMAVGAQTALTVAFALMFVVLGVLGQSVGTAVFPTLAMHYAQGNTAGFRRTLADALRAVLFTTIPAGIGLVVVAAPLIEVLYQRGEWTVQSTIATAWALSFFALGLAAFALQEVLARSFFAVRDTRTPVIVGVLGVVFNVLISLVLIRVVQGVAPEQGPFGGLALANVIATLLESIALWILLRRRLGSLHDAEILGLIGRVSLAAVAMGAAAFAMIILLASTPAFVRLIVAMVVGAVTFEVIAFALNVAEARSVPLTIWRRLRRR